MGTYNLKTINESNIYLISQYLCKQLDLFGGIDSGILIKEVEKTIFKIRNCFKSINNKYYSIKGDPIFSVHHTGHYAIFLYYLSRLFYEDGFLGEATKVYCLNKMLHSIDWYYEVKLPDIFFAEHALGSVLGRAHYSNYFFVCQQVTIGNNNNVYPVFEENVIVHPKATIIGDCHIGKNVEISLGTYIKSENIPDNSIVFGKTPNLIIKEYSEEEMMKRMRKMWVYDDKR